ncbi:uncharacterized protein K02A2.6-like [Eupeodes corollae]|uniref:uncharacterized protein K02A2.6-like n=1 Tax=Eupeodes corollae TaxID=290404 RepID=UPI002492D2A0|nr:uncharacterized protein K02A2.6-like [Eupeodes corollae]
MTSTSSPLEILKEEEDPSDSEVKSENLQSKKEITPKTNMSFLGNINEFAPGEDFVAYKDRVQQYFIANKIAAEIQTPVFITLVGSEVYKVLKSLAAPALPSSKPFTELIGLLEQHYAPKHNKRAERFKFQKAKQEDGESISDFIIKLRNLAETCRFGDFIDDSVSNTASLRNLALEDALVDKFIVGLRNDRIQQNILTDDSRTFDKCCEIALNMEMSEREQRSMHPRGSEVHVIREKNKAVTTQVKTKQNNMRSNLNNKCSHCGKNHFERDCPAKNWSCFKCNRRGHTANMCWVGGKRDGGGAGGSSSSRKDGGGAKRSVRSIQVINSVKASEKGLKVEVKLCGVSFQMEVDTGAAMSVISFIELRDKLPYISILSSDIKICTISEFEVKVVGKVELDVEFQGTTGKLEIVVVNSPAFTPLFGRTWLDKFIPSWRQKLLCKSELINYIENKKNESSTCDELLSEIREKCPCVVSSDPNQMIVGYEAEINIEPDAVPIFCKAYMVPFRLREAVKVELNRLISIGTLEPVNHSRWASPIVCVPKQNGEIRLCIDCKVTVNKYILLSHYPLNNVEDIFANLPNCSVYCVLDMAGAFQQLVLTPESRELLTINTDQGLLQYTRLPFGVSCAPSIFQSVIDRILDGIQGVWAFIDDVVIGAESVEKCKEKLFKVLKRLNDHKVRINLAKCVFLKPTVEYLGHIIGKNEVRPNPKKVEAITKAPCPTNVKELQSYLGLLNFYRRFIPDLSGKLRSMYNLLQKNTKFVWNKSCQEEFNRSKELIVKNNVLELYDKDKPIIISTDASPYGVAAVLLHVVEGVEKPVLFASSTLSDSEKNYSQLHREALAVMFAVKKFFKYIYGKHFVIYTDNQALKEIFNPKKGTPSVAVARLQRWAITLSTFDYSIKHKPARELAFVDALSRLPIPGTTDVETICINSINFFEELPVDKELIRAETKKDVELSQIYEFIRTGWPKQDKNCHSIKIKNAGA